MTSQFEPKSGLGLIEAFFLDPPGLQDFSESLSEEERRRWFLKGGGWILILTLFGIVLSFCLALAFDTPGYIPSCGCPPTDSVDCPPPLTAILWHKQTYLGSRLIFLFQLILKDIKSPYSVLLLPFFFSYYAYFLCNSGKFVGGFSILLFASCWGNLFVADALQVLEVFEGLIGRIGFFMLLSIMLGFVFGIAGILGAERVSRFGGLVIGLVIGVSMDPIGGIIFAAGFYIGYFRLIFYPLILLTRKPQSIV